MLGRMELHGMHLPSEHLNSAAVLVSGPFLSCPVSRDDLLTSVDLKWIKLKHLPSWRTSQQIFRTPTIMRDNFCTTIRFLPLINVGKSWWWHHGFISFWLAIKVLKEVPWTHCFPCATSQGGNPQLNWFFLYCLHARVLCPTVFRCEMYELQKNRVIHRRTRAGLERKFRQKKQLL